MVRRDSAVSISNLRVPACIQRPLEPLDRQCRGSSYRPRHVEYSSRFSSNIQQCKKHTTIKRTICLAGITRCKVLFLIEVHRVTQTLSSCKKCRIDLRKTAKVSGTRYYDEYPCYLVWCVGRVKKTGLPNGSPVHITCVLQYAAYFSASTEVGPSPPDIPHLLEECHDIVDYFTENGGVVVPTLDKITTRFSMLVKGYKLTSFILVDQLSSVTCTTGP